jgi:formylglycine-generating enzyme required for sulfatase activity
MHDRLMASASAKCLTLVASLIVASPRLEAADFDVLTFDDIAFVQIPAGAFCMGTTDAEREALIQDKAWSRFEECEQPAHTVTISRPFLISKYEVTQKQWKALMGSNPSAFKGDDLPVDSVSWNEAQRFVGKLNKQSHPKYRLPTEAEWEYCCRAESTNVFGFGAHYEPVSIRNLGCYAWFRDDAGNRTHPVGEKKCNLWGLYDMEGNLWEWCQDWYAPDYYSHSPTKDPVNNQPAVERVLRGGSWFLDWRQLRAAYRSGNLPEFKSQYVGFRVVRELDQKP